MDRFEELKQERCGVRLFKGAVYLGTVWRDGFRCEAGWSGVCRCGSKETAFCRAKRRWTGILLELHDGWPYELTGNEEFAVIEAMTVKQFEITKLTGRVELPGMDTPLRIGPEGTVWTTILDLAIIEPGLERDQAIAAVQKLQTVLK